LLLLLLLLLRCCRDDDTCRDARALREGKRHRLLLARPHTL
jgi:hypothetical protein